MESIIKTDKAPIMHWALNTPIQEFNEGNMILILEKVEA